MPINRDASEGFFIGWAKTSLLDGKLTIITDTHKPSTTLYKMYENIIKALHRPGLLMMEVPYNVKCDVESLRTYWKVTAGQPEMAKVVNLAASRGWKFSNIDADMTKSGAANRLPASNWDTDTLGLGVERQKFMATRMRQAIQKAGDQYPPLAIIGTAHVRVLPMGGQPAIPNFVKLLSFSNFSETILYKFTFGTAKDDRIFGFSLPRDEIT